MPAISPPDKLLSVEELAPGSDRSEDDESVPKLEPEDEKVSHMSVDCVKTVRWPGAEIPPEVVLGWTAFPFPVPLVGK